MKKKLQIFALLLAWCLTFSFTGVAFATPLDNDSSTVVLQKVKPGVLTIKAPGDVALPDVTVSSQVETTSIVAEGFQLDDARGTKVPAGWTVTATMGKLASSSQGTSIPFIDPVTAENNYMFTPQNLVSYGGASTTGVTVGAAEDLVEVDATGVSAAKTIMAATATNGKGRFECDIQIDLKVPANTTAADDYTNTVNITVS